MERPTEVSRVILVVLDGLRPDAIDAFDLHHLRRLMRVGPSSHCARTVSPSLTWPALTSLLCGVAPADHGILADSVHLPRPRMKLNPLPERLRRAGYHCSAFIGEIPALYRGIGSRIGRMLGFVESRFSGTSAPEVLLAAQSALRTQRRGLIFTHWADADRIGHEFGWMSPQYGDAARRLDATLGHLVCSTQCESDPHTLLIALADHGGGGLVSNHHGGEHVLNATIPLVFVGGALQARTIPAATLLDVPATIAWVLGVDPHPSYAGRVLSEAFGIEARGAVA